MFIRLLVIFFCLFLCGYVWFTSGDSPLHLRPRIEQMLSSPSPEVFRQERDRLLAEVESRFGGPLVREVIAAVDPLTREAAAHTGGPLTFSAPALSRFWANFLTTAAGYDASTRFSTTLLLTLALVIVLGVLWFESRQITAWQELAGNYLERLPSSPARARQLFVEWLESIQHQKDRAMDRAIQLTFALNRERKMVEDMRRELAALRPVSQEDLFEPTALVSPEKPISATLRTQNSAPASSFQPPTLPEAMAAGSQAFSELQATEGTLEPAAASLPASQLMSSPDASSSDERLSPALPSSILEAAPAPPSPPLEAFTVADRYSNSGSLDSELASASSLPVSSSPPPSLTARPSSVRRLLAETKVSDPSQLLSYIPLHPEFLPLSQLRQRKEGLLVEIRPDLDGLLWLAHSYGPESVTRYYQSLIEFIDRCFLAFPSDLARDGYSLYWYSRVTELNQEDVLTTIRGELPHVQWVGEEGVVSQIELHVTLHPLSMS